MTNQKLFEALQRVSGFTALESDMFEIIRAVESDKMGSNETIEPIKQTAVNFLIEQMFLKSGIEVTKDNNPDLFDLFNQAIEMERQQIIDIDYRLSVIEDYAKGEAADEITKLRKYVAKTFTEPKND